MLNILRKIRRNLIAEGKLRTYLTYAIGEILLIVIGILIALQLNKINEERKSRILEKDYVIRFLDDLKKDTLYYNAEIIRIDKLLSDYSKFIEQAYRTQHSVNEFLNLMNDIDFPPGELTVNNATYLEVVNAGNLNIFKDPKLKSSIIELYRDIDQRNKHIRDYDGATGQGLRDINKDLKILKSLGVHRSYLPWKEDYMYENTKWEYINDPSSEEFLLLEQAIGLYFNKHTLVRRYVEELDAETIDLIQLMNMELN